MNRIRKIFLRNCPGLKPGWFLLGDQEMWYGPKVCEQRMNLVRWAYIGVCRDCSEAFNRRGFRVNYNEMIGR